MLLLLFTYNDTYRDGRPLPRPTEPNIGRRNDFAFLFFVNNHCLGARGVCVCEVWGGDVRCGHGVGTVTRVRVCNLVCAGDYSVHAHHGVGGRAELL
jgi:hypothetical protein